MITEIPAKITVAPYQRDLFIIELPRQFQAGYNPFSCGNEIVRNFVDETGKKTKIRYKVIKIIESNTREFGKPITNIIYRLDARSIRFMKRVKIIENGE